MQLLQKIAFTVFFLLWDYCRRVRGSWRRGEYANLARHLRAFAYAAAVLFGGFFLVAGLLELWIHFVGGFR